MTLKNKIKKYRDGELLILQQSNSSYQGKIYLGFINKQTRFTYKSVKTDDYDFAVKTLKSWFDDTKYKLNNNITLDIKTKENKFLKWIDEYQVSIKDSKNKNDKEAIHYANKLTNWIKKENISQIDYPNLIILRDKYLPSFNYTLNTISHYFNYIRKVYRFQKEIGKLNKIDEPEFPVIKKNVSRRTYFTFDQYRVLINKSKERMEEGGLNRYSQFIRKSLNRFIIFQCGSGLRPAETYALTFKDLETRINRNQKEKRYYRIAVIDGKTGSREVISKPQCYDAIQQLKIIYNEYQDIIEEYGYDKDKVFPVKFGQSNRNLLRSCGLYQDRLTHKTRDINTYRHTYISWGILNGDDIYQLATNCGNTVGVIQNHYAKELVSRDFEEDLSSLRIIQ